MFGITAYNSRRYDNRAALALGEGVGGGSSRTTLLCATLGSLDGWDDSTVDGHKKKARKVFAAKFAAVYQHADNPAKLNAVLENILQAKKPN
jgi:hypothetical protein